MDTTNELDFLVPTNGSEFFVKIYTNNREDLGQKVGERIVTTCEIWHGNTFLSAAKSITHPKDNYDRRTGDRLALSRAFKLVMAFNVLHVTGYDHILRDIYSDFRKVYRTTYDLRGERDFLQPPF